MHGVLCKTPSRQASDLRGCLREAGFSHKPHGAYLSRLLDRLGVDVGHEHAPNADARWPVEGRLQASQGRRGLALIVYSVTSGAVAFVMGAIISLAAQGSERLTLWAAATGAAAVAAGIARESRFLSSCRLACGRLLRRLAKLSPTS